MSRSMAGVCFNGGTWSISTTERSRGGSVSKNYKYNLTHYGTDPFYKSTTRVNYRSGQTTTSRWSRGRGYSVNTYSTYGRGGGGGGSSAKPAVDPYANNSHECGSRWPEFADCSLYSLSGKLC
ncbi:hypothetical protein EKD16_18395 [Streptomonospora litoralis]|uniref:Uncharacterized protein n=1 Tax=Streptomonospora litoralis TaxID=2498135 RepID=A0A4P6Q4D6_9ACTN|nr:hypothetical protein EKD16_18395 [Streptomonospora litoralis]